MWCLFMSNKNVIQIVDFNHILINGNEIFEVDENTNNVSVLRFWVFNGGDFIESFDSCVEAVKFCMLED